MKQKIWYKTCAKDPKIQLSRMQFLTLISVVSAASVSLFEHRDHQGHSQTFDLELDNACTPIDRSSLQDKASSAEWDLPERSGICFFEHDDCSGDMECWFSFQQPPNNFKDDGMNDEISAVAGFTY